MHYQQSFSFYVSVFFLLFITSVSARNTVLYENPNKNITTLPDQVTLKRRGVDENHAQKSHITKHFSYINGRRHTWDRSTLMLNYALSPNHTIDYIKASEIHAALHSAFSVWSSVIRVNFTETQNYEQANITIGFYYGDHGDGSPFDNTVIAHANGPGRGAHIHFNAALIFAVDFSSEKSDMAYDLESIALHEIGHVLGLSHSSVPESIMWPTQSPGTVNVKLTLDDAYGAQLLYGSNPDFKLDSVMSPATKSSGLGEIITICVLLVVAALFSCL
ncbi:hypothetical protein MKW98_006418 [Papaver atlanticum]|uniref:Peptidase metallopeptidase domain-containing protein n=1 Tax=Papaver atlanticum TaxID=357466 RepID=A0AAD4X467_9MAGN|nr:hypothetical protein MKW98_006418 [Papaver atlanticum]